MFWVKSAILFCPNDRNNRIFSKSLSLYECTAIASNDSDLQGIGKIVKVQKKERWVCNFSQHKPPDFQSLFEGNFYIG